MLDLILVAIAASTPLLLAVEGELVLERAGIINLGIEGMMLAAAMGAALGAQSTGSLLYGYAAGVAGALAVGLLFGAFSITLRADQIVTGTAVNLAVLGATSYLYRELQRGSVLARPIPRASFDFLPLLAWIVTPLLLAGLLWNTRFGLRLRACGEAPETLSPIGQSVVRIRWTALGIECLLAGLAGSYLSLALSSGFAENMVAGRGYIALAIVIFGRWKYRGVVAGTALFGFMSAMQFALQASGRGVPYHVLLALPYVVTLLVLAGIAGKVRAPEALGKP